MTEIRWGIIGPGYIARHFADGVAEAPSARLTAVAGRNPERLRRFADLYRLPEAGRHVDLREICADSRIDALYIATPHPAHADIAIMAMRCGKHVLCEKPAAVTAAQVTAMTEVAAQQGVFFMEGLMYRCHPQIERMLGIIRSGEIGDIRHIRASFGFEAPFDPSSRLYDRALAGGAILDVGPYPVSFARLVAGYALDRPYSDPADIRGIGHIGETGVDEEAYALLHFPGDITAECAVAIRRKMDNEALVVGNNGSIRLSDPWMPGHKTGPSNAALEITAAGVIRVEHIRRPQQLFAFEAEVASQAIARGLTEPPEPAPGWGDSIGNATTLDRWRAEIGYDFGAADTTVTRTIAGVLPAGLPEVPHRTIPGLDRAVSTLIMGCDHRDRFADGAPTWDAFMEAGGNAFDTAFVYGAGRHEAALGEWIAARGVSEDVVVTAKGAHSPYCLPGNIEPQLAMSLDRLQLDRVPIYILHRDNPQVPVGEFVDALNRLHAAGRIGVFGGSNWSVARFEEANAYAAANGLEPLRILNNNLSLAVMERPVWPGCETANDPQTLAWLRASRVVHLSWSSQARGYFQPEALRGRLPEATGPERCFGSPDNAERRRRAARLAKDRGVPVHCIATAWVLAQEFPSFALIGPRSPGEIATTLPACAVDLTAEEAAWLNLEKSVG